METEWQAIKSQNQPVFPRVRVGSPDISKGGEVLRIENFYFNGYDENGIALIKLHNSLDIQDTIKNIQLAESTRVETAGRYATMIGWSETAPGKKSEILQVLEVQIFGKQKCKELLKYELFDKICAKPDNNTKASPCAGDEGGPLVTQNILIGVVGGVPNNMDCGKEIDKPWAYTPVASHRLWIDKQMKEIDPNWKREGEDGQLAKLDDLMAKIVRTFITFSIILVVSIIIVLIIEIGLVTYVLLKLQKASENAA